MGINAIIKNADFHENGFTSAPIEIVNAQTENAKVLAGKSFYPYSPAYRIFDYNIRSTVLIPKEYEYLNVQLVSDSTNGDYVPIVLPLGLKRITLKCDVIENVKMGVFYGSMEGVILYDTGWKETGSTIIIDVAAQHQTQPLVLSIPFDTNLSYIDDIFDTSEINLEITCNY